MRITGLMLSWALLIAGCSGPSDQALDTSDARAEGDTAASDSSAAAASTAESDDALYDKAYRLYWASQDRDAAEIMMPLAKRGHPRAEYWIGSQFLAGRIFAHSDADAVSWIRRSAEHGYALAQFNLGIMYRDGRRGVPQDIGQARKWFGLAAAQGDSSARAALIELEAASAD